MTPDRFEHGSEFHWIEPPLWTDAATAHPWSSSSRMVASGRDALRALVEYGMRERAWKRVQVPSYLCQEVVHAVASTGLDIVAYPDWPSLEQPEIYAPNVHAGDVFLVVNLFGLRSDRATSLLRALGAEVVEDHTHDPWSPWARASVADYCIASLRKTLPLPDGSMVWSPQSHALPDERDITRQRAHAVADKIAAMLLKKLYLEGHAIEKSAFRRAALEGEKDIASGEISGASLFSRAVLPTFPIATWRAARKANHARFVARLAELEDAFVLEAHSDDACPFSVVLTLSRRDARDALRQRLIEERIYSAILWPLDAPAVAGIGDEERDFAERMLSFHCDARYDAHDIDRVATRVLALAQH